MWKSDDAWEVEAEALESEIEELNLSFSMGQVGNVLLAALCCPPSVWCAMILAGGAFVSHSWPARARRLALPLAFIRNCVERSVSDRGYA
jgi:hypothetical protein